MRISAVIATTGRPDVVAQTVGYLLRQEPPVQTVLVVGACAADVAVVGTMESPRLRAIVADRGSCAQRNAAQKLIEDECDLIAFLDDDYVPGPEFFGRIAGFFQDHPEVAIASGHVLVDGVHTPGLSFAEADALIAAHGTAAPAAPRIDPAESAYGCNMVARVSAARGVYFDEGLPLYGWLEDLDYSCRVGTSGRIVRTDAFAGVHLGIKSGRTSGVRFGYSQVVNPAYLVRKGTMRRNSALTLVAKNIGKNMLKAGRPEAHVDRRGRLVGNLKGIRDLLLGRFQPERVLQL